MPPTYSLLPTTPESPGFAGLREESLGAGHAMLQRLEQAWRDGSNTFGRPGELLVGAVADGVLVGICGRNVDPYADEPRTGRVRHLYVARAHRRHGLGGALVGHIVIGAHRYFDCLNTRAPFEAFGFYERLGFVRTDGLETVTHRLTIAQPPPEPGREDPPMG